MTSPSVLGRRRSARGRAGLDEPWQQANLAAAATGPAASARRYCLSTSAPRRRLEAGRCRRGSDGIDLDLAELQHRALAEAVEDLERRQRLALEADLHALQLAVLVLRRGLDPLQAVALGRGFQREVGLQRPQVGRGGNQRRRRRAQRLRLLALRDLVQVGVVEPQRLAVGHDALREGLLVVELELAGALEFEGAGRRLGARRLPVLAAARSRSA